MTLDPNVATLTLPHSDTSTFLSSCNSIGAILCGVIEIGDVPGCNSMVKSTSIYGGNPGSSCSTPFLSDLIGGSELVSGCSFNSFYLLFIYLLFFLKCCDPNPQPDPNGGSEPEPDLLRPFSFILSKHFIYVISF